YVPTGNFNGSDSFTYRARDGAGPGNTVTVTLTVTPVNDPPVALDDSNTINEDTQATGNVLANDTDIDGIMLTATLLTPPATGIAVVNANGSYTFDPAANFSGAISFTYTVSDGAGGSDVGQVNITVNPVNDAPTAVNDGPFTVEAGVAFS